MAMTHPHLKGGEWPQLITPKLEKDEGATRLGLTTHDPATEQKTPLNPKIGQKYQPDIQILPTARDRKNTPKIQEKYPKNTNFVFF